MCVSCSPLPVDSPWALVRLNVHLVVIDVHLWDLHFKVVGKQLDGLAHGAHTWPAGGMKHLLEGRGEDPQGHWTNRFEVHIDRGIVEKLKVEVRKFRMRRTNRMKVGTRE